MAYMSQEKKAKIAAALKSVVPAGWKYSLAVRNHSTIVMTIKSAPIDLIAAQIEGDSRAAFRTIRTQTYVQVNQHHLEQHFGGELLATFEKIKDALHTDNYDRSDIMTDYFDVGHYVDLNIGRWNQPFVCTAPKAAKARARWNGQEWVEVAA